MLTKSDIKYIQSLCHKKFREEEQLFVVEGIKMVNELMMEQHQGVKKIYAVKEWELQYQSSFPPHVIVQIIEETELKKISSQSTPQQVIALVERPINDIKTQKFDGITVVLDRIQDPGNLGTIIRTCDWFGIKNIVCSLHSVDAFNPKVVQSAMGSIVRVNIYYENLPAFISSHADIPVYAAVLDETSIYDVTIKTPSFIVIGNESVGISNPILSLATQKISIPKYGKAASLNAAIAASIILSVVHR